MGVEVEIVTEAERLRPEASEVERLCGGQRQGEAAPRVGAGVRGPRGLAPRARETIAWFTDAANLARYRPGSYTI